MNSDGQVPLSFPAILRNPGISTRLAHLRSEEGHTRVRYGERETTIRKTQRIENDGKRWMRRKDNGRFVGNPHITQATKRDYELQHQLTKSSFLEPLPFYLARNASAPSRRNGFIDPSSADAGRFSLSLKGMRRDIRRAGGRAENLVREVESAMQDWLHQEVTLLPDEASLGSLQFPGRPIGSSATIMEVSRTPFQLLWFIEEDAFARYIVHCCARYHQVVSYSKNQSGKRITFLLRPQGISKPDAQSSPAAIVYTPPDTDLDYSSHGVESDSDFLSDIGGAGYRPPLSTLSERSTGDISHHVQPAVDSDWSAAGDSDVDGDESATEQNLSRSLEFFTLEDATPRLAVHILRRGRVAGNEIQNRGRHSTSSPSPSTSPVARLPGRSSFFAVKINSNKTRSFFDYLYL